MTTEPRPFVRVKEAAEIAGLCTETIYRAVARGDLAVKRIGKALLIPRDELTRIDPARAKQ